MATDKIIERIYESKKYRYLSIDLVSRIVEEERSKYRKDKEIEKAAKDRLHQIYGSYNESETKGNKLEEQILCELQDALDENAIVSVAEHVLKMHVSSKERFPYYNEYYSFIFNCLHEMPSIRVLDIGCGLNPFSVVYGKERIIDYIGIDIDIRNERLNNALFQRFGLPQHAVTIDVIGEPISFEADVVLLLKVLPLIENQRKGRTLEILYELKTDRFIISYPLRTLTGKNIGMERQYRMQIKTLLGQDFEIKAEATIGMELFFYVLRVK